MNENKNDKKTIMYVGLLVACLTILSLIGTYAWYSLATSKNEEVGVEAANNLKLVYTDCNTSDVSTCADINKDLSPGDSVEKVFEVTNTSGVELSFTLYFQELLNTFKSDDLVYKLENITSNEVIIPETPVPYAESKLYNQIIGTDIKVPGNATSRYKLTITFLNRDRNQNENLDAKYFLKLSIMETKSFTLNFDANGGVVDISSKQVESGKAYGELPVPTREDYEFLGWYTERENGTLVEGTSMADFTVQTLYARWSMLTASQKTLAKLNKSTPKAVTGLNFANIATTDETAEGLYSLEDDYGTSYFYRGAVEDNYVKFGDYYWRIIRVNGDGSIRMIYDGTSAHANGESNTDRLALTSQAFNTNYNDAKYVGYMYAPSGTTASTSKSQAQTNTESSTIKTKLEEWYETNIKNKGLDEYVEDSVFCYDRTAPGKDKTGWSSDTGLGYGTNVTAYGATARTNVWNTDTSLVKPQFTCENKNDAFTVSDTEKGNGALSQKVGLITADEVVAGGGKFGTINQSYYLYKGSWYWAGSPYYYHSSSASVFSVHNRGHLDYRSVDTTGGVAPVINLSAEYFSTLIGDGTIGNEYRLS